MAGKTSIEWTEYTWNPVTGCSKISPGCYNCYAERMAKRLQAMGQSNYKNGFILTIHEDSLRIPFNWKRPSIIFVNSMSDLFHEEVPLTFIKKVFDVMCRSPHHIYQILTKRSERLAKLSVKLPWASNIWMGVSIENSDYVYRSNDLKKTGAKVKFLSMEPLLGSIPKLKLVGINWVIVGGESGPKARIMHEDWVIQMRNQCLDTNTPFFFKQWGGMNKKKAGRILEGKIWDQMPAAVAYQKNLSVIPDRKSCLLPR
jgi:protein gp37